MRKASKTGYGITGNPRHPYHTEYGPDTYYPAPKTERELRDMHLKAQEGLQAVHDFFAAQAVSGNVAAMAAWDDLNKTLNDHGMYSFACGKRTPWKDN